MGILSPLFEKRSYGPTDDYWYMPINKTTASGVNVDEYNALEYGDVYKCVRVIAETIASLPLFLYKRTKDGGKEKADEHPLYNLLHLRPNSEMTKFQYEETKSGHLLTWGNTYSQIERNMMGEVINLWPLRPDRMEVTRGQGSDLLQYEYRPTDGTDKIVFRSEEILHIPGLGFNGISGYSPITMAREAIGLGKAAAEFSARFFSNDASPGGILKHPNKLSPQAHDNLKKSLKEAHGGLANKWNPMILEEGLDWQTIGISMRDAQFLEIRKFQRTEICGIYRVPPHMIADTEPSTSWGSGIESQTIGFIIYTIMPWLIRIEQAINFKLLTEKEQKKYFAEHLLQGLMRGDSTARGEYYTKLFNIGVFSQNDILRLENMNPIGPEGDKRYVPLNMAPVGEKRPEPLPPKIELKPEEIIPKEEKVPIKEEKSDIISTIVETAELNEKMIPDISQPEILTEKKNQETKPILPEPQRYKDPPKAEVKIEADKLHGGFKRIWEDNVARIVRRESIAIRRGLKRQDINGFESYMGDFYRELPEFMSATLHPSLTSYGEMVNSTSATNCMTAYIDNHIKESKNEISGWAGVYVFSATSDSSIRTNGNAIDDCLDMWAEKRPEQAAEFFGNFFSTS